MRYRRLGRTELLVSEIGLGGGGLRCSTPEYAVRLIRRALELGVNYFDTAPGYGDSEDKLGIALEGCRRDVFIATKLDSLTAEDAERELAASLRRLRTDYVDVLQIHDLASLEDLDRRSARGGVWETLERAKRDGRARFIGVTGHRPDVVAEALRRHDLDTVLFILNVVQRDATTELMPLALSRDVGMVVMKPLGMGLLPARPALRYLLSQPIACAIPGPSRLDWLEADVSVAGSALPLDDAEVAEIERLRVAHDLARCRQCDACEPCPQGVRISYVLGTYRFHSDYRNMGREGMLTFPWGELARERFARELASISDGLGRCDGCARCEALCPYHLPVVALLKGLEPALEDMKAVVSAW